MPNGYFEYLLEERKVISTTGIEIPEKMQRQLDYIANAIHDTGFTPKVQLHGYGRHLGLEIKYKYEGNEQGIYFFIDLPTLDVDDTIVTLVLPSRHYTRIMYYPAHSSRCILLEKVSQRYFISLVVESTYVDYIPMFKKQKCKSPTILLLEGLHLTKIKWISFYNNTPTTLATKEFLKFFGINTKEMLPELERLKIRGTMIDGDCKLLSKLISEGIFAGKAMIIILGDINFYSPDLNYIGCDILNKITDDGALKLIHAFKNKADAVISLHLNSCKISSNTRDKLKKLNEQNERKFDIVIKLMISLVKESTSSKKEEFGQIVETAFLQILKDGILEMFLEFKNNPKIHKIISEKLNPAIKDNNACVQQKAQNSVKNILTEVSTAMITKYILPDITDIKNLKDLPPKVESLVHFLKLPLELQEKILQLAGLKIFSSCFSREELQGINDLKEICTLLYNIKTEAATDCVQSNKLLLSQLLSQFKSLPQELQKCVKDNIKSLVFDTKIAAIFSGTDAESSYNLLQSTVNEVEDLLSKLREQTTEGSTEVAIAGNISAYNIADSNNTIDQPLADLLLVGN